jgi:beta-mannosidase
MSAVVELDGQWEFREAIGETWRWYAAAQPPASLNSVSAAATTPGWLPAVVPGSVVDALATADAIPDPRRGFGSRYAEWTATRHWVFRRTVQLDAEWVGDDVVLELDGIDPGGRVLWDGEEVARVDGLYRAVRVRITVDAPGAHRLVVVIDPVAPGVPQVGRTEDVRRHAPRMGYGWDFCPPFPHQGIWRPVRLRRGARIASLEVDVRCDEAGTHGVVHVRATVEAASGEPVVVQLDTRDGRPPVETEAVPGRDGVAEVHLQVTEPPLWQPLGYGSPRLAEVRVRVGQHEEVRRIGFRHSSWELTPGSPKTAEAYGLRVNGSPIPLVGINWAPADAQYGSVTPERIAHLLDLAVAAGVRLVRVWGGGLVETPEFYDACDERGLLVWQEFSQSSSGLQSAPSEDDEYVAALVEDARLLVPARRHHPSLVLWGGGNELEGEHGPLSTEDNLALRALAAEVTQLDPERGWLPTSPSGPAFHHRLDVIHRAPQDQHDVHGPWEYQGLEAQHTLAAAGTAIAHTEFGVEGMANRRLYEHVVPAELREPADRSNPIQRHLGEWWDNEPQVQELFGGGMGVDELRRASQWLQSSGLAVAIEADRRRWPRTSMVLPWQLAESYPNAWGTALVGFDGEPKPALGAVSRAFRPERATIVTARTAWGGHAVIEAEGWVWSEQGRPSGSRLTLAVLGLDGSELATTTSSLPEVGVPVAVARLQAPAPRGPFIWLARWTSADGEPVDEELVLQTGDADLVALRSLPSTRLVAEAVPGGWRVRNVGPVAAVGWGPRDVRPGDDPRLIAALGDPRPLLPSADGFIALVSGRPRDGELTVDAWNAPAVALSAAVG